MQTWEEIIKAIQTALAGRSTEARESLQACWDRSDPRDAAQRCVIAHYLADQQDDLHDEIAWDERALAAFADVAEDALVPVGVPSTAGFAVSLHLNLGDGYLRAGELAKARVQVQEAQSAVHLLPAEGYGAMVRGGVERLAIRVEAAS